MNSLNFKNFTQSLHTKNSKYGGYATLLFLFMLTILIVVNLIAEQLPLKFDLSQNQLFSLSKQTIKILKELKQDITIYALYSAGKEDKQLMELLQKYPDTSSKIQLKTLDPNKNPGFVKRFSENGETPGEGSLLVTSGKQHKVIQYSDLFNYYTDQETMQQEVASLAVEQRVTGAILYFTSGASSPVVYQLQGHGEATLPNEFTRQLQIENYTLKGLTLATQIFPADAAILMVYAPQQDITVEEAEKIRQFLANRGRALFLIDYVDKPLTNLNSVLASYGIALEQQIVVEGNGARHVNNPLFLLPQYNTHSILASLESQQMQVLIPVSQSLKPLGLKRQSVTVEPLLMTSAAAWAKTDPNSLSQAKDAGDPQGPFTLAVAITDSTGSRMNATEGQPKMVVFANAQFTNSNYTAQVPGNSALLNNSLSWLHDQKNSLTIQPKNLLSYRLRLNAIQTLIYSALVVLVIPIGIMIAGLIVWLRRRHL